MKKLASLAVLVLVASCGLFGGDESSASIVGTWTLQSVNGDPLPANIVEGQESFQITAGTAVVAGDNTFTYSETWDGQADLTVGTWSQNGDTYTFNPTENVGEETSSNGTVTLSGNTMTLTVVDAGVTYIRILTK
jgi:hypothetical protein